MSGAGVLSCRVELRPGSRGVFKLLNSFCLVNKHLFFLLSIYEYIQFDIDPNSNTYLVSRWDCLALTEVCSVVSVCLSV